MITPPPVSVQTGNWAGYEWNGGSVAAAEFVVPSFPYSKMNAQEKANKTALSIWAGLTNGPDLEQIGVYDYVTPQHTTGWAGVCAFWPLTDDSCGHGIAQGDRIAVSVHRSGFTYTMAMRDYGPHNVWAISVKRTLNHADTRAAFMAEDSNYPGTPFVPLSTFSNFKVNTSGNPTTMFWSRNVGSAKRLGSRLMEIFHR